MAERRRTAQQLGAMSGWELTEHALKLVIEIEEILAYRDRVQRILSDRIEHRDPPADMRASDDDR